MTIHIKAHENGPIVLDGDLTLESGGDGKARPAESSALCRCGRSGKGLFCDGTHTRVDFRAEGFELIASPAAEPSDRKG